MLNPTQEPGQGGPRALTQEDYDRQNNELRKLQEERDKLVRQIGERGQTRDAELKEAKAAAAAFRRDAEAAKEAGASTLAALQKENALARKDDAARCAECLQWITADEKRISALEKELSALKSSATTSAAPPPTPISLMPPTPMPAPPVAASDESLGAFLARLQLSGHLAAFVEEELDVMLLRSMGPDLLQANMAELGLSEAEASRVVKDLFPAS